MYKYDLHVHSSGGSACGGIKVNEHIKTTEQLATVLKSNKFELYLGK